MPVRSPTAACRRRFPALPAVLAAVLLVLGAGTHGHAAAPGRALSPSAAGSASPAAPGSASPSAAAGGSSRAGSPTAMFMPAPTQADLSDATLEVPEICALRTNPGDATQGAIGTVTFTSGKAESPPGDRSYLPLAATTIKEVTSSVIDGRPVAVATVSCAYGGAYADDAIVVYDSSLSLVAAIDPRTLRGDLEGHIDDLTIDAVSANAVTGDLVLSISQIGMYGDQPSHFAAHSGSANIFYTWASGAHGYTPSDVVYTIGDKKVRMPRVEDVQAFYTAVATHDDDTASKSATPEFMSALQGDSSLRQMHFSGGGAAPSIECVLLSSTSTPDAQGGGAVYFSDGRKAAFSTWLFGFHVVRDNDYQAGDMMCALAGNGEGNPGTVYRWLDVRGKEDGSFEVHNSISIPTC